jgi:hypothetical protein
MATFKILPESAVQLCDAERLTRVMEHDLTLEIPFSYSITEVFCNGFTTLWLTIIDDRTVTVIR